MCLFPGRNEEDLMCPGEKNTMFENSRCPPPPLVSHPGGPAARGKGSSLASTMGASHTRGDPIDRKTSLPGFGGIRATRNRPFRRVAAGSLETRIRVVKSLESSFAKKRLMKHEGRFSKKRFGGSRKTPKKVHHIQTDINFSALFSSKNNTIRV